MVHIYSVTGICPLDFMLIDESLDSRKYYGACDREYYERSGVFHCLVVPSLWFLAVDVFYNAILVSFVHVTEHCFRWLEMLEPKCFPFISDRIRDYVGFHGFYLMYEIDSAIRFSNFSSHFTSGTDTLCNSQSSHRSRYDSFVTLYVPHLLTLAGRSRSIHAHNLFGTSHCHSCVGSTTQTLSTKWMGAVNFTVFIVCY